MMDYSELPSLSTIYLEDSYVMDIVEEPGTLKFRLDAVLTESHPSYHPPKPNEQYCYAYGWLIFPRVTEVFWEKRSNQKFTDATGEEDLGNIDYLKREDDYWLVGGSWGDVRVSTTAEPYSTLDH